MFTRVEVSLRTDQLSLWSAFNRCIEMNKIENKYYIESYNSKGIIKFRICQFSQI